MWSACRISNGLDGDLSLHVVNAYSINDLSVVSVDEILVDPIKAGVNICVLVLG